MADKAHERYKWIMQQVEIDEEYLGILEELSDRTREICCYMP